MKRHGPWKITSSEVKYKNPWIEVVEDKVIRPDGTLGIYGVVKFTASSGISVLAIDREGFVYLTREFKYASAKEHLEVVSGGVNVGEAPLEAAKRELNEELGIQAAEWIDVGVVEPFTGIFEHKVHLFIARNLVFGDHKREGTEATMKMVKMKLGAAIEQVMQSKITHGQSCVLILKAKEYLKREKKQ